MVKNKENPQYGEKKLTNNYDIAYDFASKTYQKFKEIIKSIILFGSVSKNQAVKGSDIDIIIVVDDASVAWDQELIAWYREELAKLIESQNYSKEIHINTVTLSAFWEEVKAGTPVIMNVIRYGQPLIDFGGFFEPLKVLLARGRIRPSPEAIFTTLQRAPEHIERAKFSILSSVENIYWAMVDSAHSALMAANQVPPSPEHISELLDEVFVRQGALDRKYLDYYNQIYTLTKDIMHGNVNEIKTADIDVHLARAAEFEQVMRTIASRLIEQDHIVMMQRREDAPIQSKVMPEVSRATRTPQLNNEDMQFPDYNVDTDRFKKQSDDLAYKNKELMSQILQYKSQLESLSKDRKAPAKEISKSKDTEMLQYKTTIAKLESQNRFLSGEIPGLKKQVDELQRKNKELIDLAASVKQDRKQGTKTAESDLAFPEFNPELDKLKQSNKELLNQITQYKSQLQAVQTKVKQTPQVPLKDKQQTLRLQDQIQKLQEKNETLSQQIPSLKKQIDDLATKNKDLMTEKETKQKQDELGFPEFNPELEKLKTSNEELNKQIVNYKSEMQKLDARNKEFTDKISDLKEEQQEIKSRAQKASPEMLRLKKKNKDILEEERKANKKASEYESKINSYRKQLEEMQKKLKKPSEEIPSYKSQIKRLNDQISSLETKNKKLFKEELKVKKLPLMKLSKPKAQIIKKEKTLKQKLKKVIKKSKIATAKKPKPKKILRTIKKSRKVSKPVIKQKTVVKKQDVKKPGSLEFPDFKPAQTNKVPDKLEFPDFK